jgi:hypothetical protein
MIMKTMKLRWGIVFHLQNSPNAGT